MASHAARNGIVVRVHALGRSAIEIGCTEIGPKSPRMFALALFLAVERGSAISRASLALMLWPNTSAVKRRRALRQLLYRFRRLGAPEVERAGAVELPRNLVWIDFEDADSTRTANDAAAQSHVRFLPDYNPTGSLTFARWLDDLRSRVSLTMTRDVIDTRDESRREIRRAKSAERERDRVARARHLALIGRTDLMATLLDAVDDASGGNGSVHHLWGPGGIGKTRVLEELETLALRQGAVTIRLSTGVAEARAPLSTLAHWLPVLRRLPGALGVSPASHALLEGLTSGAVTLVPGASTAKNGPGSELGLELALIDLFDAVADEGTLVLLIDDLQFGDRDTLRVLHRTVACRPRRIVVVTASRERGVFLDQWHHITPHHLSPLTIDDAATLVAECSREQDPGLRMYDAATIVALSNGLPHHLVCAARCTLADRAGSAHGPRHELERWLQQQVESLAPLAVRILCALSTCGGAQRIDWIATAVGRDIGGIAEPLEQLREHAIVAVDGTGVVHAHMLWLHAADVVAGAVTTAVVRAARPRAVHRPPRATPTAQH